MERVRAPAIYCDCVHTDKYIAMAARYRAEVDRLFRPWQRAGKGRARTTKAHTVGGTIEGRPQSQALLPSVTWLA